MNDLRRSMWLACVALMLTAATAAAPTGSAVASPRVGSYRAASTGDVDHTLSVVGWGQATPWHEVPVKLERVRVVQVAAGAEHSLALTGRGRVVAWGSDRRLQLDVPQSLDGVRVTQVAAGGDHSLALTKPGAVIAWGFDRHGESEVPATLEGVRVTDVAAGSAHNLASTKAGQVVAWGDNRRGQSDVPGILDGVRVTQVAAGGAHSLALTRAGRVVAWGDNSRGQSDVPGTLDGVRVTQVAAGFEHSLALTETGHIVAWGGNRRRQVAVPRVLRRSRTIQVAAGGNHSLALTETGQVIVWGDSLPVPQVLRRARVTQITAGSYHNLVLTNYHGPDLRIARSPAGPYVGNNFYETRAQPDLGGVREAWVWWTPSVARTFYIRLYNDSNVARTFRVRGTTPREASRASYYYRGAEVTRRMESTRGITVRIRPHDFRSFRTRLTLGPWRLWTATRAYVSANWVGHPGRTDRVKSAIIFSD